MTKTPTPPKLLDREPSEAMIEAGRLIKYGEAAASRKRAVEIWTAMHDAAPASPPHDGDVRERIIAAGMAQWKKASGDIVVALEAAANAAIPSHIEAIEQAALVAEEANIEVAFAPGCPDGAAAARRQIAAAITHRLEE